MLFVEGSISARAGIEIVRLRAASKLLVTIGASPRPRNPALRTAAEHEAFRAAVYPAPAFVDSLEVASPVASYVTVDADCAGCPIDPTAMELLTALTTGRRPAARQPCASSASAAGSMCVVAPAASRASDR